MKHRDALSKNTASNAFLAKKKIEIHLIASKEMRMKVHSEHSKHSVYVRARFGDTARFANLFYLYGSEYS